MRSRNVAVAVTIIVIGATGCSGTAGPDDGDTPTADGGTRTTSDDATGEPAFDFSGSGDEETEPDRLSGDYEIRGEISGNRTPDGDEAGFSVLMHCDPGPSFTSIVSKSQVEADSGTKHVSGLDGAECFLEVHAQEDGEWTVEFFPSR